MKFLSLSINGTPINPPGNLPPPGTGMAEKILGNAISIFLIAGVVVSILTITWSGIQWISSGGDKQKLAAAKARITWAIIGLIVMFVSFLIIIAFESILGIKLLSPTY